MAEETLPSDVRLVRTTPELDEASVPPGLLGAHRVAEGVWGRLVVRSGSLRFVFDDDPHGARSVAAGGHVVIPPRRVHHLEIDQPVTFVVEFHRAPV